MRVGQNPAKFVESVHQPAKVTVAVVVYIPFLSGYYAQSLDVLKTCLNSIWEHTDLPYDLLVFDNASCAEVRQYLKGAHQQGRIQFLTLSDQNLGKAGAWNFIFGAAPGDFIAYADSDIYFYPGWLGPQIAALEAFPQAGMVTGMPLRTPPQFSTSTFAWAQSAPGVSLERGKLLPWEDYWRHSLSLGADQAKARQHYDTTEDICLISEGRRYYVGAGHFQFVARKSVLQRVLPIPSQRPMGQVRLLDIAINEQGYLRLSTPEWWIRHMGNTLDAEHTPLESAFPAAQAAAIKTGPKRFFQWSPVRRVLLAVYGRIFDVYFR